MPRTLGPDAAVSVAARRAEIHVPCISGHAKPILCAQRTLDAGLTPLEKPFTEPASLANALDAHGVIEPDAVTTPP
jgi:hypothetical protein